MSAPLVLTLEMDGESFRRLNELRRRYYPPERNLVPAHLTLFHQLPGDRARDIKALLRAFASDQRPIEAAVQEVKDLESGVAMFLRSPALHALRDRLQAEWWPWLAPQDQAGFQPHVTIQNRVPAAEAAQTRREIAASFRPWTMRGLGLHLWRYQGGPWEDVQLFRFGRS